MHLFVFNTIGIYLTFVIRISTTWREKKQCILFGLFYDLI